VSAASVALARDKVTGMTGMTG